MWDGTCNARGAIGHGDVSAALVEAVDGVVRVWGDDGEVVVGCVGCWVN